MNGRYEKPWVGDKRMKRYRYNNLIVWLFMFIGLGLAGYICYDAQASVPKHEVRNTHHTFSPTPNPLFAAGAYTNSLISTASFSTRTSTPSTPTPGPTRFKWEATDLEHLTGPLPTLPTLSSTVRVSTSSQLSPTRPQSSPMTISGTVRLLT